MADSRSAPPAISLPKGEGATRGMGEKFSADTGSLSGKWDKGLAQNLEEI
jgi:hypothetical protein